MVSLLVVENAAITTDRGQRWDLSVETILLQDDIIQCMAIESSIKNLLLLVLAIIIVVALWRAVWFLAGLAIFVFVVYIVYLLLKGNL